jgi:hypothetical protein
MMIQHFVGCILAGIVVSGVYWVCKEMLGL